MPTFSSEMVLPFCPIPLGGACRYHRDADPIKCIQPQVALRSLSLLTLHDQVCQIWLLLPLKSSSPTPHCPSQVVCDQMRLYYMLMCTYMFLKTDEHCCLCKTLRSTSDHWARGDSCIHPSIHPFTKQFSVTSWHEWQPHSEHFLLGTIIISRFLGTY